MTMNLPPIQPARGELTPVLPHPAGAPGLTDVTAGPAAPAAGPEPDDDEVEDLQDPITDVTAPMPAPPPIRTPIIGVPAATTSRGRVGPHDYWAVADDAAE